MPDSIRLQTDIKKLYHILEQSKTIKRTHALSTLISVSPSLCLHTSKSRHHGITLYVCMVCQSWSAGKSGSFSNAANWKAKKVPSANDVVYAKGSGETDIKVDKE